MPDSGGCGVRTQKGWVGWLAVWVVASCGYPELPRLSIDDANVDGPPLQYSSCMGLALTCGAGGTGSCCEPADTVEGGTFLRGYDAATDAYNDMNYPATVSTFVLDKYEVTVGRFRTFVEAELGLGTQRNPPATGAGAHPRLVSSGWESAWNVNLAADTTALMAGAHCDPTYQTWTDAPGVNENKPINCVTWDEAMAFCIWDGGYLPTEAEWNYAAAGGDQQRPYPWSFPAGDLSINCSYANYLVDNPAGTHCVNGTMGGVNRVGSESTRGDGRWKHSDLAGNVMEWTLDGYVDPYPNPQSCNDCANLTESSYRVLRGGGFNYDAFLMRAAYRNFVSRRARNFIIGFRCARTP
jgi:formylglycine-generating enzyme required for sulfatase activity